MPSGRGTKRQFAAYIWWRTENWIPSCVRCPQVMASQQGKSHSPSLSAHLCGGSKYQYTTRLNKWEMKKNTKCNTWKGIHGGLKRKCLEVSEANVFLDDRLLPLKKVKKELQRYTAQEGRHNFEVLSETSYSVLSANIILRCRCSNHTRRNHDSAHP